ncbi:MAG: zinc ribbon domain-containing protein [Candidatus Paceibacterota bacterium]
MYCSNCSTKIEEGDKFCKKCGQEQERTVIDNEKVEENDFTEAENQYDEINDEENENEVIPTEAFEVQPVRKESFLKKIFKGVGTGGLVVGGGFLYISFTILQFLFVAFAGLSMIGLAISLFSEGSIIWGLVALFIGTPLAIGFAIYFFIFFLFLGIISLIIWGVIYLFGFNVSFGSVWDGIWLVIKILILGGIAFFGVSSFIEAVKNKNILSFFKENWFYILIFFFLFWLFF